jgi:hypothetical protein
MDDGKAKQARIGANLEYMKCSPGKHEEEHESRAYAVEPEAHPARNDEKPVPRAAIVFEAAKESDVGPLPRSESTKRHEPTKIAVPSSA